MQPETLTPDMRIIGFFTDLRNVVQLVDDQVVVSSYIIISLNTLKSIGCKFFRVLMMLIMMQPPQGWLGGGRAPWRAAFFRYIPLTINEIWACRER